MLTEGRTDMTKVIVTFQKFANASTVPAVYLKRIQSAHSKWIYSVA